MIVDAVARDLCPDCDTTLDDVTVEQPALFVHGGYGATTRTVLTRCPGCGWSLQRERSEVRPPRDLKGSTP